MKIVHISDTHNHFPKYVPHGDVLVHTGDATDCGTFQEFEDFLNKFEDCTHKYKIFIPGNHDFCLQKNDQEYDLVFNKLSESDIYVLRHDSIVIEGYKFFGSCINSNLPGWAFYHNPHLSMSKYLNIPKCDILLTHEPPRDILDLVRDQEHVGSEYLRNRVNVIKPKLHLFGHIHESKGVLINNNTLFINNACGAPVEIEVQL